MKILISKINIQVNLTYFRIFVFKDGFKTFFTQYFVNNDAEENGHNSNMRGSLKDAKRKNGNERRGN